MTKLSKIWTTSENLWYEELKVIAPYREYQYDRMIQSHLKTLFPEYHSVPYNKRILQLGKITGSRPDFALVRKDYQEWWIVEVERIEDNLSHVRKQIEDFVKGNYNSILEAKHLYASDGSLDLEGVSSVTQENPKVMIIVDDINSKWCNEFKELEPTICVLKVYRNKSGLDLYSISGDYPYIFEDESHCHFSNAMKNMLKIINPDVLTPEMNGNEAKGNKIHKIVGKSMDFLFKSRKVDRDEKVFIVSYKGQISKWKRVDNSGDVFLQPIGPVSTSTLS